MRSKLIPLALGLIAAVGILTGPGSPASAAPVSDVETVASIITLATVEPKAAVAAAAVRCPSNVTARMRAACNAAYNFAKARSNRESYLWDSLGCRRSDRLPWHPSGRACDLVYGRIGRAATGDNLADGNAVKNWLKANHTRLGLHHIIWQGRIWSNASGWGAGRVYSCRGVTDCHRDHIHVAVR